MTTAPVAPGPRRRASCAAGGMLGVPCECCRARAARQRPHGRAGRALTTRNAEAHCPPNGEASMTSQQVQHRPSLKDQRASDAEHAQSSRPQGVAASVSDQPDGGPRPGRRPSSRLPLPTRSNATATCQKEAIHFRGDTMISDDHSIRSRLTNVPSARALASGDCEVSNRIRVGTLQTGRRPCGDKSARLSSI